MMTLGPDLLGPRGEPLWVALRLPKELPPGWRQIGPFGPAGAAYQRKDGLKVIATGARQADGKRWLHVSCSYLDRLPNWADLSAVKAVFIGEQNYAVQVLPPKALHVNLHPYVLHLFSCVDGHPLPEFSGVVAGRRSL